MPEMVASYSSQRFSALLDFQRDVDLVYPSHIGQKNPPWESSPAFPKPETTAPNHHRARYSDASSWQQQNWSASLSTLLSSTFRPSTRTPADHRAATPPRPCAVQATSNSTFTVTRSHGQFSPQTFIRHALKRAFAREDSILNVKRARFEDFASTLEPMVCG